MNTIVKSFVFIVRSSHVSSRASLQISTILWSYVTLYTLCLRNTGKTMTDINLIKESEEGTLVDGTEIFKHELICFFLLITSFH